MSIRETLAAVQHEIWSHWMNYLFRVTIANPDGSVTIPADKVARWRRQAVTPYEEVPDAEREGDREQADKVLRAMASE